MILPVVKETVIFTENKLFKPSIVQCTVKETNIEMIEHLSSTLS